MSLGRDYGTYFVGCVETMVHIVLAVLALDNVIVLCCGLLDISDYYPLILYEGVGVF